MRGFRRKITHYWPVLLIAIAIGAGTAFFQSTPRTNSVPAIVPLPNASVTEKIPDYPVDLKPASSGPRNTPVVDSPGVEIPPPPEFVEIEDGKYEAETTRYVAQLSSDEGLKYRPRSEKLDNNCELNLRLRSVAREGFVIYDRESDENADADPGVDEDTGDIAFWRAPGFEERYTPRGDGIEQSFNLERLPAGGGDLQIVCDISAKNLIALPPRGSRNGGIYFVDSNGHFAARYGQVMVRDSEKRAISIEPALSDGALRFSIPGVWLDLAKFPIEIDPLVGGDFLISPDNTVGVGPPSVLAGNNSFLVIWTDYRDGLTLPQLYASIVSVSGIPSIDFPISAAVGLPRDIPGQRIQGAFDGSNWLVVWSDDRAVGAGIRGAVVSAVGDILGGSDFPIAPTTGVGTENPLVVFNGVDFVVAWQTTPPGQSGGVQIQYARVTSAGVVDQAAVVPELLAPISQTLDFLAPQRPSGDTLLIYRENNELPPVTRSVRIAIDGTLRDPGGTTLFKEDIVDGGFGRAIGATWVNTEWHILSSFDQTIDSSVFLHKFNTTGTITPPTGIFAEFGGSPINSSIDQYAPAFAGAGEWLFIHNEKINGTVYHLLGKRVTFAGVDLDPTPFQIDTATQGVLRNSVAAQAGSVFLAAWLDGRRGTSQPADGKNIVAALIDAGIAGTGGTPLVAAISASPVSGEAPLAVSFDAVNSTGSYDTLTWNFGDGTSSTTAQVSHTYKNNGTYLAQLILTKGAYSVHDSVVITVGNGVGNGESTQIGTPVTNSPGMVTELFISSVVVRLNFATEKQDSARVAGVIDPLHIPDNLTGVLASISIGSFSTAFNLDAKGAFKSDTSKTPIYGFGMNQATGQFAFEIGGADLRAAMDALGGNNMSYSKAFTIQVPISVSLNQFSATALVGAKYKATKDVSGVASYQYGDSGNEISGAFLIKTFSAKETARNDFKVHDYNIKGQVTRPNGDTFKPGVTGSFQIIIGDFVGTLDVGELRLKNGILTYIGKKGVRGIRKFMMDIHSGKFTLQMSKVPANVIGGSNLPVSKAGTNITRVDLNFSFVLDLDKSERFSAGRYIPIIRKNANARTWKLR